MWSGNLKNEEALAHLGCQAMGGEGGLGAQIMNLFNIKFILSYICIFWSSDLCFELGIIN